MEEILSTLLSVMTWLFAVSSMLNVGLSYTWRQIVEPLKNGKSVVLLLLANFVLAPALA